MIQQLTKWIYDFFNLNPKKEDMLNLVLPFVANMLKDLVVDKAQSLASEHLEKHIDKLPKEVQEALDSAVDGDNAHGHKSLKDLIKG